MPHLPFRILLCLLAAHSFTGRAQVISFRELVQDAGPIMEGPSREYRFKFTNTGGSPLIITRCQTADPHVAEWPGAPIMPGKQGTIIVTMPTEGRTNSFFKKTVQVFSNAVNANNSIELVIKGRIYPDSSRRGYLYLSGNELFNFDSVIAGARPVHTFVFRNAGKIPLHIEALTRPYMHADSNRVSCRFNNAVLMPGNTTGIRVVVNTTLGTGYYYQPVYVHINNGAQQLVYVSGWVMPAKGHKKTWLRRIIRLMHLSRA